METIAEATVTGILPEIQSLNFDKIKRKFSKSNEGQIWTKELCDFAEVEYKRYLTMIRLFPELELVPTDIMDKFWHQHILDTQAYADDCENIFGRFVHHAPFYGVHDDEESQQLSASFDKTKAIYKELFGDNMEDSSEKRCKGKPCHVTTPCRCR